MLSINDSKWIQWKTLETKGLVTYDKTWMLHFGKQSILSALHRCWWRRTLDHWRILEMAYVADESEVLITDSPHWKIIFMIFSTSWKPKSGLDSSFGHQRLWWTFSVFYRSLLHTFEVSVIKWLKVVLKPFELINNFHRSYDISWFIFEW